VFVVIPYFYSCSLQRPYTIFKRRNRYYMGVVKEIKIGDIEGVTRLVQENLFLGLNRTLYLAQTGSKTNRVSLISSFSLSTWSGSKTRFVIQTMLEKERILWVGRCDANLVPYLASSLLIRGREEPRLDIARLFRTTYPFFLLPHFIFIL
jgi:hypothetical protein